MINDVACPGLNMCMEKAQCVWPPGVCTSEGVCACTEGLTFDLWLDKVEHLAEAVLERQGLDSHGLQLLALLLVEIFQLIHTEHPVPIQVHTAEPVLYTESLETLVGGMSVSINSKRWRPRVITRWRHWCSCVMTYLVSVFLSSSEMRNHTKSA